MAKLPGRWSRPRLLALSVGTPVDRAGRSGRRSCKSVLPGLLIPRQCGSDRLQSRPSPSRSTAFTADIAKPACIVWNYRKARPYDAHSCLTQESGRALH